LRVVVQRVSEARVMVDGQRAGEVGHGLVVLLGVARDDTEADAGGWRRLVLRVLLGPELSR
jgi:D-tyrosyl-tRNA(Tyr) deacylase